MEVDMEKWFVWLGDLSAAVLAQKIENVMLDKEREDKWVCKDKEFEFYTTKWFFFFEGWWFI